MGDNTDNSKTIDSNKTKGFASHPENINRNGRPKRGWAWNELIEDAVNETVKNQAGEELEVKKLVVKRLVKMASEGDLQAIREIINRMDGMPVQPNAEIPEDKIDNYLHTYRPDEDEK